MEPSKITSTSPIISTDELTCLIETNQTNLKILDCSTQMGRRGDCCRLNFLRNHVKGAIFLDLDNLKDHKTDLPYMMP